MLIRLTPDQIAKTWDLIRYGFIETWPAGTECSADRVQSLLRNLLAESVQCWIGKDGEDYCSLVLTKISICDVTGSKSLNIITLYGFKIMPDSLWLEGIESLRTFAKVNGCKFLTAISDNSKVLAICRRFNFTQTNFVSLEV